MEKLGGPGIRACTNVFQCCVQSNQRIRAGVAHPPGCKLTYPTRGDNPMSGMCNLIPRRWTRQNPSAQIFDVGLHVHGNKLSTRVLSLQYEERYTRVP